MTQSKIFWQNFTSGEGCIALSNHAKIPTGVWLRFHSQCKGVPCLLSHQSLASHSYIVGWLTTVQLKQSNFWGADTTLNTYFVLKKCWPLGEIDFCQVVSQFFFLMEFCLKPLIRDNVFCLHYPPPPLTIHAAKHFLCLDLYFFVYQTLWHTVKMTLIWGNTPCTEEMTD